MDLRRIGPLVLHCCLSQTTFYVAWTLDNSEVTLLALIDLSKGFDAVDHFTLPTKIEQLQLSSG